jgi:hypothetical protein
MQHLLWMFRGVQILIVILCLIVIHVVWTAFVVGVKHLGMFVCFFLCICVCGCVLLWLFYFILLCFFLSLLCLIVIHVVWTLFVCSFGVFVCCMSSFISFILCLFYFIFFVYFLGPVKLEHQLAHWKRLVE